MYPRTRPDAKTRGPELAASVHTAESHREGVLDNLYLLVRVRGGFPGAWVCVLGSESPVVCLVSRCLCPCRWVEIGV